MKRFELSPEKLRSYLDPNQFPFQTTEEITPSEETIGQERAVNALEFGINIKSPGFNVYVAGLAGTGKEFTVKSYLQKIAKEQRVPSDWCYVYNFAEPHKPMAVELPPGMGRTFAKDMNELIEDCKTEISKAFESEEYRRHKNEIVGEFESRRDALLSEMQKEAEKLGFSVKLTATGILTIPVLYGKPLKEEEYEKLSEATRREIDQKSKKLKDDLNQAARRIKELEKEAREKVTKLDRQVALFALGHLLDALKERYREYSRVIEYLDAVQQDIVEHLEDFKAGEKKPVISLPGIELLPREPAFERYRVNVLINNADTKGAPVIFEPSPTYYNLLGRIEYQVQLGGALVTDFTKIGAGAIHRANGGYLVIRTLDVLTSFMAWDALKRTLRSRQAIIENIGEQFRLIPAPTLKPEPIPIDVKVVMIGHPLLYYLLYQFDEDFRKLFKVKADFDLEMDRTPKNVERYATLISRYCHKRGFRHFDRSAVAKVVEYGSRLVEDQEKLSTRFMDVVDIIAEANFWAERDGDGYVRSEHVKKAIEEKIYRSRMIEEKIQELIEEGTILIDTAGETIGQVNGISLVNLGDYAFGKPTRITARTYMGKAGVVNIEREAEMSGRIHSKAVMILTGYLGERYAADKPLSVSASVCFEQLYEEVEGDSASSAELYAILSSLSGIPLKQGIAVTGSVNQRGEIQPVGGINEKIEGFFYSCKTKGLTGDQGVIIPHQNVKNLMLREEVIKTVREGKFHIYVVKTADEGIEILTGIEAGVRRPDGTYPRGTVNHAVDKRLHELAEKLKGYEEKKPERKK